MRESPNVKMSNKDFSAYGLQGKELPKHSTDDDEKPKSPPIKFENSGETIGLKLVDLGLGDEFDGRKGKEKGVIKKNAVEWYLKKEHKSPKLSS